jgi:hypothetical protein
MRKKFFVVTILFIGSFLFIDNNKKPVVAKAGDLTENTGNLRPIWVIIGGIGLVWLVGYIKSSVPYRWKESIMEAEVEGMKITLPVSTPKKEEKPEEEKEDWNDFHIH